MQQPKTNSWLILLFYIMMGCYIKVNVSNAYIKIKKSKMARRGRIEFSFFCEDEGGVHFYIDFEIGWFEFPEQ